MQPAYLEMIKGKRVLFVTTKDIEYIRNSQEIRILEKEAGTLEKIYSDKKKYGGRVFEIWAKLARCKSIDFDTAFIGFAPQLIFPFFRKFSGKKIIIDFFISIYDTLVNDRKKIAPQSLMAKFCHWLDSYVIKRADIVLTDTKADASYFIQEFQGRQDKFETLYLEADRSYYYPRQQCKDERLKNKFVVLYFGSILPLQGVDIVLKAASLLEERDDIWIQIIGPVPSWYDKPVQRNIEYIEWLPQERLADYIANADLCLAGHFSREIDKASRTIPGKAYIYQSMQKTMVCGDNRANRELFTENETVHFVPMGNPEKLKEVISFVCTRQLQERLGA